MKIKMCRRFLHILLATFIFTMTFYLPVGAELSDIEAESYILIDADSGAVLEAKNEHAKLPPASMTKLMTLLLAMEALETGKVSPQDMVKVSRNASDMGGSQIYLAEGEQMSFEDLMISIAVGSANDSCVAVAEYLAGSEENFVKAMNEKAAELKLNDTNFVNTNGLPAENHYSSAYDMAMIGYHALKFPRILEYTAIKEYDLRDGEFKLYNTNKLLWWYEGADGLKTGWTTDAKYCLTATAKRDGLRLISSVIASPHASGQFKDSMQLLNYGFARYGFESFFVKGNVATMVQIGKGQIEEVEALAAEDVGMIFIKSEEPDIRYEIDLPKNLSAPVMKGEKIGEIVIYEQDTVQKKVDLLAGQSVAKGGVLRQILKMFGKTYLI